MFLGDDVVDILCNPVKYHETSLLIFACMGLCTCKARELGGGGK